MVSYYQYKIYIILLWMNAINCMNTMKKSSYFMDTYDSESDIAEFIKSKGYIPNEKDLPKASLIKDVDNDVTYLLSKLSDEKLLKLLSEQPKKKEYNLNDIVKVALGATTSPNDNFTDELKKNTNQENIGQNENTSIKRFRTVPANEAQTAFFKLDNKIVDPYKTNKNADPNYLAIQKINNLLYSRPMAQEPKTEDRDENDKKELLFDILVSQLKSLCCEKNREPLKGVHMKKPQLKSLFNEFIAQDDTVVSPTHKISKVIGKGTNEFIFLILNDEIISNGNDDLISVDPESLSKNSSALLLGPITTPLTDTQLKLVMKRIANELSKQEYIPLLQQLSENKLKDDNLNLIKSLVTGPETRRYIKPHRCNHQSKLARIYGGPKWIICTGYLNLNTPSLYD